MCTCMNCKKAMKPLYKVKSFSTNDYVAWENVETSENCLICPTCGTVRIGNAWFLTEDNKPSEKQLEKATKIYRTLHFPMPFPTRRSLQNYIADNEKLCNNYKGELND